MRKDTAHSGFGNRFSTMTHWLRAMVGHARPERVFSVAHTGGDLSAPDTVRAQIQPEQFPVLGRASSKDDAAE
jgi:hypothetical protein